jgi:hypothetical protein
MEHGGLLGSKEIVQVASQQGRSRKGNVFDPMTKGLHQKGPIKPGVP